MTERFVVIAVTLLTLIVMCGLLLAAIAWVPGRIDRLEKRLDQLEEVSTKVTVMHNQIGELDRLEEKLSEATQAAAPLARIDSSLDETIKKLDQTVVPVLNDLKGRVATRNDVKALGGKINQIHQKLSAAPASDPAVKKLAAQLAELKRLLEATHKKLNDTSRDIGKDVKLMHLEIQKLEALVKQGAPAPE